MSSKRKKPIFANHRKTAAIPANHSVKRQSHVRILHTASNELPSFLSENEFMNKCEKEQTKIDRFWGFEKESASRARELQHMYAEDARSQLLSQFLQFEEVKRVWETNFETSKQEAALSQAILREERKRQYMKVLLSDR